MGFVLNLIVAASAITALVVYGCPQFSLDNNKVDQIVKNVIDLFKAKK